MEFRETFVSALRTLGSHKMRSALTMLGIIIGAGSLVAVMSLIAGLNQSVTTQFQSVGTDIISVSKFPWVQMGSSEDYRGRKDITMHDSDAIESLPSIGLVAPNIHTRRGMSYGRESMRRVRVSGTTPEYETIDNYAVESGRFLTQFDVERRRQVVVIASEVSEKLFGLRDPIGKDMQIGGKKFVVIGILEEKGDIFGETLDEHVLIPITTFRKAFGSRRSVVVDCQPADGVSMERAMDDIRALLRVRRQVPRDKPDDFAVNTQEDLTASYKQLTGVLYFAMTGIVALALLVGGIGVMNVMLVSVAERTREIGVRKAIGARRRDVTSQFLIESVILTALGGALGIGGGAGIGVLVRVATPLPAATTPAAVGLAVGFSLITGIVFGVYPALRAGRLNPIQALSYE
ncbi:ABC transporter permease [bacterium]|jgi:putative ABC transport system permease protein|nr:ABC transporter permease [bacterium]